jgi:hypothetical protein
MSTEINLDILTRLNYFLQFQSIIFYSIKFLFNLQLLSLLSFRHMPGIKCRELHNVESQNVESQNVESQNVESQNVENQRSKKITLAVLKTSTQ